MQKTGGLLMIVDSHIHLGPCTVFGLNIEEKDLLKALDDNNVEKAIVQPFPGAPNPKEVHDRIAKLSKQHPGRIYGIASLSPHIEKEKYDYEVRRCVEDYGFLGVKLHTVGHAVIPLTPSGDKVFEIAAKLGIVVNVHTGPGIPFALPALCIPKARQYPETPIVLAHAGFGILTAEAYVAAKECPNIYLETSWCLSDDIKWLVSDLGADRVMMGSDSLTNLTVELAKYKSIGLSDVELNKCLSETAVNVFKIK